MPYIGRGDFNYRVIRWDRKGVRILEEPAGVDNFDMAVACYLIAIRNCPDGWITLQQGSRVIRKSRSDL